MTSFERVSKKHQLSNGNGLLYLEEEGKEKECKRDKMRGKRVVRYEIKKT